jgi:protein TonB
VSEAGFTQQKRRPRPLALALIVIGHLLAVYALARLLAPSATEGFERAVLESVTVFETDPEPPPPPAEDDDEAGAEGTAGEEAVPRPVAAPSPSVAVASPSPVPRAASTGTETRSGGSEAGTGTGAGEGGLGTGSGGAGTGRGGGRPTPVTVRSGRIDSARDFPIPEGGRQVRRGTSVVVHFTVGTDGRASDCRVARPGPDPATNALVCPLVIERIRFNPATDRYGRPVPARFGWRQDFF